MMNCNKRLLLIIFCIMFFIAHGTYKTHIQKQITFTLPYYPAQLHWLIQSDLVNKMHNIASFLCGSRDVGQKKSSLSSCTIVNNPTSASVGLPIFSEGSLEQAVLNHELEQTNPLYDASIMLLNSMNGVPVVVTQADPSSIYMIENSISDNVQSLLGTPPLNDATGVGCDSITGLAIGSTGTQVHIRSYYIFAALNTHDIAVIKCDSKDVEVVTKDRAGKEKTEIKKEMFLNVLNAQTGESHGNRAATIPHDVLSINNGKGSVNKIRDLYWCQHNERLYIALDTHNDIHNTCDQGMSSLLVGRLDAEQRLCFDKIIPDQLLTSNDKIVGTVGHHHQTIFHKIRSLETTSGLNYMLLNGGQGTFGETAKKVYALPVTNQILMARVDVMNSSMQGVVAAKNANCVPSYTAMFNKKIKLIGRGLTEAAASGSAPTMHDSATQVGAGKELPNAITDIIVARDAVFVTVAESGAGQLPGIFHSQAILDSEGKIAAWTPWQRIAGVQEGVKTACINKEEFFVGYLRSEKPELVCQINFTIPVKSEYLGEDAKKGDLSDLADTLFPRALGGVQGLYDFSSSTDGFNVENPLSMLVMAGYKKVVLAETGNNDDNGLFTAYKTGFTKQCIIGNDAMIPHYAAKNHEENNQPRVLVLEGGVLDELRVLTQAVVVHDAVQSWLIVGGPRGMAILCHEDGSGWRNEPGLSAGFCGIEGMSFKKFGNWNLIKKITAYENHLYVLTNKTLERIDLKAVDIKNGNPSTTSLLIKGDAHTAFFDVGVSGPLALIATSQGLLVNNAMTDCRSDDCATIAWRTINLPDNNAPVYNLFFVSRNGHKNGFSHSGQVYASAGSLLENSTNIYRLYIHDVFREGVTDTSVELVSDQLYLNVATPFIRCKNFRDHFATNGTHYFSARSRQTHERPHLELISTPYFLEYRFLENTAYEEPLAIGKVTKNITALVQNSATGNWLVGGDFGLRIHN